MTATSLGNFTLTSADTQVSDWTDGFDGIVGINVQTRFIYGSGSASCKVYIQTSLDDAVTAVDIACMTFTTAGAVKIHNFTNAAKTSPATPADGALADDTGVDGILGDRFRIKVVSTGTYAGQTAVSVSVISR